MITLDAVNTVEVVHGVYRLALPLAGRGVGGVRQVLAPLLNIGAGAMAVVNGTEVGEDYILEPNDLLEFVRLAGEKGVKTSTDNR